MNRSGFTLLGLLVAIGISSILMMSFFSYGKQAAMQYARLAEKGAIEDIRNHVRISTYCVGTEALAPPDCTTNPRVQVQKGNAVNNIEMIAGTGAFTTFGNYEVRARCENGTNYIMLIDVRRIGTTEWKNDIFREFPHEC